MNAPRHYYPTHSTRHLGRNNTYNNGQPYVPARGRYARRDTVEDYAKVAHPVIHLAADRPTADRFLQVIVRELKIRCYQQKTIKAYRNAVGKFLRWFGALPHQVTREDVRNYLETLVDGGADSSWISTNLSAIRTTFDKLCGASVTLGLASPRRRKKLPVVLSRHEMIRLLEAAVSLRDKLAMGLMYATGVRVSEVVRLRWRDFDFDRLTVNVWKATEHGQRALPERRAVGSQIQRTDRVVMLPETFRPLLQQLSRQFAPEDFVFPGEKPGRYLSPQTVRRAMARAVRLAGIAKKAAPHSLRHGFACHLLEDGTDIRFSQQFLGHVRLETTTIYTKVAQPRAPQRSPLDALTGAGPLLDDRSPLLTGWHGNVVKPHHRGVARRADHFRVKAARPNSIACFESRHTAIIDQRLEKIGDAILREVPGCNVASDQAYREDDLAIDFCEDVERLPRKAVLRIKRIFEEAGAQAKISSIHVNGWFGPFDKLSMVRRCLRDLFDLNVDAQNDALAFCGDSPNDEPLFRF
jgi:site-specific recombinase XerD